MPQYFIVKDLKHIQIHRSGNDFHPQYYTYLHCEELDLFQ